MPLYFSSIFALPLHIVWPWLDQRQQHNGEPRCVPFQSVIAVSCCFDLADSLVLLQCPAGSFRRSTMLALSVWRFHCLSCVLFNSQCPCPITFRLTSPFPSRAFWRRRSGPAGPLQPEINLLVTQFCVLKTTYWDNVNIGIVIVWQDDIVPQLESRLRGLSLMLQKWIGSLRSHPTWTSDFQITLTPYVLGPCYGYSMGGSANFSGAPPPRFKFFADPLSLLSLKADWSHPEIICISSLIADTQTTSLDW